jgi:hypothetical protein
MKPSDEYKVCSLEEAEKFSRKREMKPHKHAELIKAWADGAEIQVHDMNGNGWYEDVRPTWNEHRAYRIKPEPKPDVLLYSLVHRVTHELHRSPYASMTTAYVQPPSLQNPANLKLTFDGETGELKSAEVIKLT